MMNIQWKSTKRVQKNEMWLLIHEEYLEVIIGGRGPLVGQLTIIPFGLTKKLEYDKL